ncbi:hypothetical protein E8E15_000400 [Penicillium rubens]|nr:hypothetical protein E8E15_000400 [Penicillium rubens]
MADPKAQSLHDFAIITIINIFVLLYFYLFVIHFLLFYFPSSPRGILDSLSVLVFCAGVIFWCTSSVFYRFLDAFRGNDAAEWQKLEFGAALVLIWAATVPSVVVLFRTEPYLELGYISAFTVVAIEVLVDFVICDPSCCVDIRECVLLGDTSRANGHLEFS